MATEESLAHCKVTTGTQSMCFNSVKQRFTAANVMNYTNRIVNNRRTSITKRFVTPVDGWVENAWCVVKGDPEGDYSIKVYLNNQFIKKFDFEIRKLPKKN